MNFDDTPEEAAYRAEVRRVPRRARDAQGRDELSAIRTTPRRRRPVRSPSTCAQCKAVAARASSTTAGPASHGRRRTAAGAARRVQQGIFNQEQARYDVQAGVFSVGIGMTGPTLIAHGTEEQKQRYLRPMLRGRRGVVPAVLRARAPAAISPGCARRRCATATSGSSTVRRSGTPARTTATGASCSRVPTPMYPSTAASRTSWSTCALPASTCGRCDRSPAPRTSTRSSSPMCASRTRTSSVQVNAGWGPILTTLANERTLIGVVAVAGDHRRHRRVRPSFGVAGDPTIRQELMRQLSYVETIKYLGYRMQSAASTGATARPRELGAQARRVAPARASGQPGDEHRRCVRHVVAGRRVPRRVLAEPVPRPVDVAHRRRHRSDAAQHHRREGAAACRPSRGSTRASPSRTSPDSASGFGAVGTATTWS